MTNPYSVKINQITLENFQSLKEKVEIPIRPLTFLYGPNSAGKSSIFDSLKFVDAFFKKDDITIQNLFRRWAHKSPSDVSGKIIPVEKMTIQVSFSSWEFLHGGWHGIGEPASVPEEFWGSESLAKLIVESEGPYDFDLKLIPTIFQSQIDGDYVSEFLLESYDLTISVCGLKIMRLHTPEDDDVYEVEFFPAAFGSMFTELADRHGVSYIDSRLLKVQCWPYNFGRGLELQDDADNGSYERDLVKIANHIIRCFSQSNFLPTIVSSDRTTIPNTDLSNFFNSSLSKNGIPLRFLNAPVGAVEAFSKKQIDAFSEISDSKFRQLTNKNTPDSPEKESLFDFVNRALSHHLFLDQGYQICFDVCKLSPPNGVEINKDIEVTLLVGYLMDSAGRKLTFEDVGTGISCVVPVLVGMHGWQSFIQQPELHLHPALQSALGDIFVESVNREKKGRHFIETHSDYLLLRCLRRIRETTNGRLSNDSNLRIQPTDVSILYFEPQSDGSTRIKPIRVSSQGDFLDRWPRGFFEERGKDLFDE